MRLIEWWRRRQELWTGPHYRRQIAILAPAEPLDLPPIKPLKAEPNRRALFEKLRRVK